MQNRFIGIGVRIVVSVSLLALIFYKTDTSKIGDLILSVNPALFIVCLFIALFTHLIATWRWKVFVAMDHPRISTLRLFSFYLVGLFFSSFLPTSVGGDVVRIYDLYKEGGQAKTSFMSVFVERMFGMTAHVLFALTAVLGGYVLYRDPVILWLICGVSAIYFLGLLVLLNRGLMAIFLNVFKVLDRWRLDRFQKRIQETYHLFLRFHMNRQAVIKALSLSLLMILISSGAFYLLSIALHLEVSLIYFLLFFPIMNLAALLPISLGGLGIREGVGTFLFMKAGLTASEAFALSLGGTSLGLFVALVGAGVFMLRRARGLNMVPKNQSAR